METQLYETVECEVEKELCCKLITPANDECRVHRTSVCEELLGRRSHVWRENNPEWMLRRASLAAWPMQEQLIAQHNSCKSAHQLSSATCNVNTSNCGSYYKLQEFLTNDDDDELNRPSTYNNNNSCQYLVENSINLVNDKNIVNHNEVSSSSSFDEQKMSENNSTNESSRNITTQDDKVDDQPTCSSSDQLNSSSNTVEHNPTCIPKHCYDSNIRSPGHDTITVTMASSSSSSNRPTTAKINGPRLNVAPSDSTTCCTEYVSAATKTPELYKYNRSHLSLEDVPNLVGSINHELKHQEQQRKNIILSMALKQIAQLQVSSSPSNSMHSNGCCKQKDIKHDLELKNLESSSDVQIKLDQKKSITTSTNDPKVVLSQSRSVLIDSLCHTDHECENNDYKEFKHDATTNHQLLRSCERLINKNKKNPLRKTECEIQTKDNQKQQVAQHGGNITDDDIGMLKAHYMRQLVTSKTSCRERTNDQLSDDSASLDSDDELVINYNSMNYFTNEHHQTKQSCETMTTTSSSIQPRSFSVQDKCCLNSSHLNRVEFGRKSEINLESLIIESWLDDHPDFAHDYFARKATRQMIDDWLVTNARVSNTNQSSRACDSVTSSNLLLSPRPTSQQSHIINRAPNISSYCARDSSNANQCESNIQAGSLRPNRSNSQSATLLSRARRSVTPIRKISATDFQSRTGSGYLRPMLSKTPDGKLTFLPQINPNCNQTTQIRSSTTSTTTTTTKTTKGTTTTPDFMNTNQSFSIASTAKTNDKIIDPHCNAHTASSSELMSYGCEGSNNKNEQNESMCTKNELKLIFGLVKDIYDDLDITTLLYKILKNIAVLINADRSSLFIVCGGPNDPNRRLVSQLFNVDQDGSLETNEAEESITIPWGTGLVGYVAASGESVNIVDCYKDHRFTDAIDQRTGYVTKHMLCAPIFDKHNEIVGVAQVINKRDGNPFSESDELKFKRYLQFCGIGLRNAQSYEQCLLENRRNQVLLDMARMVFEEQSTIEQVVHRIMLHTQSLLDCERCQVLLIDKGTDDLDAIVNLPECSTKSSETSEKCTPWQPRCLRKSSNTSPECCNTEQDDPIVASRRASKVNEIDASSQPSSKLFSLVFDLECDDGNDPVIHQSNRRGDTKGTSSSSSSLSRNMHPFPINIGITGYVAMTGETLNIENAHEHNRFDINVDANSNFKHKSILCMPIRNGQRQIIGVSQLINKKNGQPFNKNDEDLFEAFAIFCGLGIHNTLMYERVLKVMAKQRVTFEVLSYHATAPLEEAKKLSQEQIPSCFALNLASLKFNDFSLDDQYMLKSCLRFFLDLDLMRRFQIDQLVFCNWILSVQKNYRKVNYHPIVGGSGLKASPVRYHNWRHAFNVSQMMFAILVNTKICHKLGELETLALLIACLCHDLDHRGTNNSFQIKSASPLADLYSTSTMEHHHFDQCVMILNSQGNQILSNLSPDEYSRVIMLLEEAILATDLANYFQKRDYFFQLVNSDKFDWHQEPQHRSLLRCMLMTACDVAAITKPWPVQKIVADLVMSEFYQQGDIEKNELNIEPIDMMNREKMDKLPSMQIGFIDSICAPIYTAFARLFPHDLTTLMEGCLSNRELWSQVDEKKKVIQDSPMILNYLADNPEFICKRNILLPTKIVSKSEMSLRPQNLTRRTGDLSQDECDSNACESDIRGIKIPFVSCDYTDNSSKIPSRTFDCDPQRKSV